MEKLVTKRSLRNRKMVHYIRTKHLKRILSKVILLGSEELTDCEARVKKFKSYNH